MQLVRSVPVRVGRPATPSSSNRALPALVVTWVVMLAASMWFGVMYASLPDECALPSGASALDAQSQLVLAQRAAACRDLQRGRITLDEYRALIGIGAPTIAIEPEPETVQWASSVRAVSSEYSPDQWSAKQVLGAPDVYPQSGDLPHAWASREPDAPWEFIEVGFAKPGRIRGLQVYETNAPGAITQVEIITADGARKIVYEEPRVEAAATGSQISTFEFACSDEPIVAARVTLASGQVAGWNEIDAIGALPCK
jgi:hypothetical protein